MPGPCSAPNGDARLVELSGEERVRLADQRKLNTGKTRLKRERASASTEGRPLNE